MGERPRSDSSRTWWRARAWVLPNPSGLNARYQLPDLAAAFAALREAAAWPPTSARPGSQPGGPA